MFFIGCEKEEDESTGEVNLPPPKEISEEDIARNWPEDIPLMEPYTIQNFMSSEAFTQLVIVVIVPIQDVVQYYVDNLEAAEWEIYGDMQGAPPVMISWQCRKDDRELDVMIRYDSAKEASFVTLKLGFSSDEVEG